VAAESNVGTSREGDARGLVSEVPAGSPVASVEHATGGAAVVGFAASPAPARSTTCPGTAEAATQLRRWQSLEWLIRNFGGASRSSAIQHLRWPIPSRMQP